MSEVLRMVKRITDTNTWAASTDMTAINLPKDGLITEFTIRADITATLTATAVDDYFRRIIQNIRIEGSGGKAYLGMSGVQMSTMLSLWGELRHKMPTIHSNGAGIALAAPDVGSTTFTSVFKFHPGSNPHNPFDLSAAIPAQVLSQLQARLTTTAAAVPDNAGNITAGTFRYEVHQVVGLPVPKDLMVPVGYSTVRNTQLANTTDFGFKIDIPGGAWLRSIIMVVRDDTATRPRRKNDEVTGVRLERPRTNDYMFEQLLLEAQSAMCARWGWSGTAGDVGPIGAIATIRPGPESLQSMVPAGFLVIDLRQYEHPLYGLDLTNFKEGDYKLGLTIENYTAGDAVDIYWDFLAPVDRSLVGRLS